jgi:quercetin dioxygenase-like cupin family protein
MTRHSKGSPRIVQPDEGNSYWRPKPANGYVTVTVSPGQGGGAPLAMGIQVLPRGGFVPEHSHAEQDEFLFCFAGKGCVELDGVVHPFVPGTTVHATPWTKHKIVNTGPRALKFTWTMLPSGLETYFSTTGRARRPGGKTPAPFDPPPDIDQIQVASGFGDLQRHK